MRLLEAKLPSGHFFPETGIWLTRQQGLAEEILAVLEGPLQPGPWKGWLKIEAPRGRYKIQRDFLSGAVKITTLRGRPAPNPRVLSPAAWVLGRLRPIGRRPESPAARHKLALEAQRASLVGLIQRLKTLGEKTPSCAPSREAPATAQEAAAVFGDPQDLLRKTVQRLFEKEAAKLEHEARREARIETCLRSLKKKGLVGGASILSRELEEQARRLNRLNQKQGARPPSLERGLFPWVVATSLAGAASAALGQVLGEALLLILGTSLAAGLFLPALVWQGLRSLRTRRIGQERKLLLDQAGKSLLAARILPPDGPLQPETLMEAAQRVRVREQLRSMQECLQSLLPDKPQHGRRERRLQVLKEGIPSSIQKELARLWQEDPLLALPCLLNREPKQAAAQGLAPTETANRQRLLGTLQRRCERLERLLRAKERQAELLPAPSSLPATAEAFLKRHQAGTPGWPCIIPPALLPTRQDKLVHLIEKLQGAAAKTPLILSLPPAVSVEHLLARIPRDQHHRVRALQPPGSASIPKARRRSPSPQERIGSAHDP